MDSRSANFSVAHVPCKEGWTSTPRMEASVGSLKFWLIILRSYEWCNRRRPGCKSVEVPETLAKSTSHQSYVFRISGSATQQPKLLK